MKTEIEEKFERFHRKEVMARRITFLLAFVPFVIGAAWMYFAYINVQDSKKQYAVIKEKSLKEEARFNELKMKKQQLEMELMNTYGLPADSILNSKGSDILFKNSIKANDVIKKISGSNSPGLNTTIRYYYKTLDEEKIILSLKSLGYSFEKKQPSEYMTSQKTNCIWFGSNVSVNDCKIVALALIRAGIEIKAIRGFRNNASNPSFKADIIEIGGDRMLEYNKAPTLTVAEIENARGFQRDASPSANQQLKE